MQAVVWPHDSAGAAGAAGTCGCAAGAFARLLPLALPLLPTAGGPYPEGRGSAAGGWPGLASRRPGPLSSGRSGPAGGCLTRKRTERPHEIAAEPRTLDQSSLPISSGAADRAGSLLVPFPVGLL